MSIYTCIMQIEQRTKIWSLLLVTINKILCQFFEFTQNLKRSQFIEHFGYYPNHPNDIDFDQDAYAEELLKCVEDNFDYTIKKYGTVPKTEQPKPEIIWD